MKGNTKKLIKKYFINNKNKEVKAVIKSFKISEEYNFLILKLFKDYEDKIYFKDFIYDNETLRIIYCTNGYCKVVYNIEKNKICINKNDIIIQIIGKTEDKNIIECDLSEENTEFLILEIDLKEVKKNFLKEIERKKFEKWKQECMGEYNINSFYKLSSNEKIKEILREIELSIEKNIDIKQEISKYIKIKLGIISILLQIFQNLRYMKYIKNKNELNSIRIFKQIKNMIDTSSVDKIPTVKEICQQLSLSRYQIHTIFEKYENKKLTEYIEKKKLKYAKKLLKSNKKIIDISREIGYMKSGKFSRMFKKYYGILPSEYQKIVKLMK